jgi:hypothetical protein
MWIRGALVGVAIVVLASCGGSSSNSGNSSATTGSTGSAGGAGTTSTSKSKIKLYFNVNGEYNGHLVQGAVDPSTLQCTPIDNGGKKGVQVVWGGTVAGTGEVSGDISFAGVSSIAFGNPTAQGAASAVVKGDYQNRYGASSALGSGTASVKPDNSGTVDAQLIGSGADTLKLTGSFQC